MKKVPRGLHYVCRLGQCEYYQICEDGQNQQLRVDDDLLTLFARLGIL